MSEVERLKKLRSLFDEGFITKPEYDARRLQILEGSERPPPPSTLPSPQPKATVVSIEERSRPASVVSVAEKPAGIFRFCFCFCFFFFCFFFFFLCFLLFLRSQVLLALSLEDLVLML
jgi:hypothetical protein